MIVTLITGAGMVALLIKIGDQGPLWDMGLAVGENMQQVTHILDVKVSVELSGTWNL